MFAKKQNKLMIVTTKKKNSGYLCLELLIAICIMGLLVTNYTFFSNLTNTLNYQEQLLKIKYALYASQAVAAINQKTIFLSPCSNMNWQSPLCVTVDGNKQQIAKSTKNHLITFHGFNSSKHIAVRENLTTYNNGTFSYYSPKPKNFIINQALRTRIVY